MTYSAMNNTHNTVQRSRHSGAFFCVVEYLGNVVFGGIKSSGSFFSISDLDGTIVNRCCWLRFSRRPSPVLIS